MYSYTLYIGLHNDAELGPLRPDDVGVIVKDDSTLKPYLVRSLDSKCYKEGYPGRLLHACVYACVYESEFVGVCVYVCVLVCELLVCVCLCWFVGC